MKGLDEIRHIAAQEGIITPSNRLWSATKEQLMNKLARKFNKNLLPQFNVMLAQNLRKCRPEVMKAILNNEKQEWIAEEKLNGLRGKFHFGKEVNRIDSRNRSDVTYEFGEKTESLVHFKLLAHHLAGTVLDGELKMPVDKINNGHTQTIGSLTTTAAVVNSSPERALELQVRYGACNYYAFDVLYYCGEDVRKRPYYYRRELLQQVHTQLPMILLPKCQKMNFEGFFKNIIAEGGEGILLKHKDWDYQCGKRIRGQFKYKARHEMDCFITGSTPGEGEFSGLIGALLVSVLINEQKVEVAAIQPGSLGFRQSISLADGSLRDDMYGKVVEVSFFERTKNGRLRDAVLEKWQPELTCYDCQGKDHAQTSISFGLEKDV
jgi:ATP-dependent DNA ligase